MPAALGRLYFCYGSNLWLQQMDVRCPNSRYVGRAILPDYSWQINQRGYANVVPASGYCVHGIVYRIGATDEARLDRNEGVNSGAYSKHYKGVVLYPALSDLALPTWKLVDASGGPAGAVNEARRRHRGRASLERKPRLESRVLVYISTTFTRPGTPGSEYIDRMNRGIRDAMALGVPADYFENAVRRLIPWRDNDPERSRGERRNAAPLASDGGRMARAVSEGPRNGRGREGRSPGRGSRSREDGRGIRGAQNVMQLSIWGRRRRRNSHL